jgi:hypothetical protein
MTLAEKIIKLYPELKPADFVFTIKVQNNSDGTPDYLAEWKHPTLPRPTNEELA